VRLWSWIKGVLLRPFVPTTDEQCILDLIEARRAEGITSMRVVNRCLIIDPDQIAQTKRFKAWQAQAARIVNRTSH